MTPQQAARTFLDACADIETTLRKRYNLGDDIRGLGDAVRATRRQNAVVRRYENELAAFKDLRNAISHSRYRNGQPIAVPLPETIAAAQRVRDELVKPTTVATCVIKADLYVARLHDQLRPHLEEMLRRDYSQVPVFDGDRYVGLLTTNAIARWVADAMDEQGDVLIGGTTVEGVLDFGESYERGVHVGRDMTVAEAVEMLLAPEPPLALLVTHSGRPTEKLLGMLVAADLPRLRDALHVSLA